MPSALATEAAALGAVLLGIAVIVAGGSGTALSLEDVDPTFVAEPWSVRSRGSWGAWSGSPYRRPALPLAWRP